MPSDALFKWSNRAHRIVLKATGGRLGWTGAGMPVVQLTTIGRKTGEPRTVMLTAPIQRDETYVVVASRGGTDVHPAWYFNVQANPEVTVAVRGATLPMRARVADPAERAELWAQVVADFPHYAGYQDKTDREIPLVVLEPR
jgi:deazaflavin-dependent oxidoreductase (nitroreductase family)